MRYVATYIEGKLLIEEYKRWDHVIVKLDGKEIKGIYIGQKNNNIVDKCIISPVKSRGRLFYTSKNSIIGKWNPTRSSECGGYCEIHTQ